MTEIDPVKGTNAQPRHPPAPFATMPSRSTRAAHALAPWFWHRGAIFANVISLFYFASLYASG